MYCNLGKHEHESNGGNITSLAEPVFELPLLQHHVFEVSLQCVQGGVCLLQGALQRSQGRAQGVRQRAARQH